MNTDIDKTNLLILAAQKMPKTEALKIYYRKTAKTLNTDMDFGRAMRALD